MQASANINVEKTYSSPLQNTLDRFTSALSSSPGQVKRAPLPSQSEAFYHYRAQQASGGRQGQQLTSPRLQTSAFQQQSQPPASQLELPTSFIPSAMPNISKLARLHVLHSALAPLSEQQLLPARDNPYSPIGSTCGLVHGNSASDRNANPHLCQMRYTPPLFLPPTRALSSSRLIPT